MRKIKIILIIVLNTFILLGLVELGFYLAIGDENHPTKLKDLLAYTERKIEPERAKPNVDWPGNTILVRKEDAKPEPEYLKMGGKTIPGSYMAPSADFVTPEETKEVGKKNIFVVGGSAAFGYTCSYPQTFAAIIDKQLGSEYNVVNTAQVGWNTSQLVPVVKRIADYHEPSVVIIMCGNNELINWGMGGVGTRLGLSRNILKLGTRSYTLSYMMHRSIMGKKHFGSLKKQNEFLPHQELSGYQYAVENPAHEYLDYDFNQWKVAREKYLKNFENNLIAMIYYAKHAGAEVVLMTVPLNYKLSPVWKHPQPWFYNEEHKTAMEEVVKAAVTLIEKGNYHGTIKGLDAAITLEPEVSILHYLRAHSLEQLGNFDEAKLAYEKSREYMVGNLGSITSLNEITAKVAANSGVSMIDLKKVFDEHEHGNGHYFNETLIRDDCHPSDKGQELIAEEVLSLLSK